tara:strand:- start:10 stop:183 length:174 start_codon:yes stop_codon:yes gene_type:complete
LDGDAYVVDGHGYHLYRRIAPLQNSQTFMVYTSSFASAYSEYTAYYIIAIMDPYKRF